MIGKHLLLFAGLAVVGGIIGLILFNTGIL